MFISILKNSINVFLFFLSFKINTFKILFIMFFRLLIVVKIKKKKFDVFMYENSFDV